MTTRALKGLWNCTKAESVPPTIGETQITAAHIKRIWESEENSMIKPGTRMPPANVSRTCPCAKKKNMTQRELAEKLDISESYYNQIENGERQKRMDITIIDRLSKALDISVNDIICFESQMQEDNL